MTEFLLKSTVAMGVLLGLYYVLFEKEKMHRFNRFYLLGALVLSLALPFITVITYIEYIKAPIITESLVTAPLITSAVIEQPVEVDYTLYILESIYGSVTLFMLSRFVKNSYHFIAKASANKQTSLGNATLVLVEEETLPHTFLNYIFVNRACHEAKQIEDELYTHEYTHVKQKHTLDIIFIEILRVIFWFNPLLYFYKKAIQLNHEFLADEKVIETNTDAIYYQTLLLSKVQKNTPFALASQLTFSLTKKRLIMMTKTTSTIKSTVLKLTILPVITGIAFMFCTETIAQTQDVAYQEKEMEESYNKTLFRFKDQNGNTVDKKYTDLTPDEKKDLPVNSTIKSDYIEFNQASEEQMANDRKNAQEIARQIVGTDKVYTTEEVSSSPMYLEGPHAFYQHIAQNTRLPKELSGDISMMYSFVVEKNGTVSNVKAVKDAGYGTKEQITAILTNAGKWLPGKKDNEKVRTLIIVPITLSAPRAAKSNNDPTQEDKIVENKDLTKQPEYNGGLEAFLKYVKSEFKKPAIEKGHHKTYYSFVIEKDGSISNFKVLRSKFQEIDTEVERILVKSGKWNPGEVNSKPVRTMYYIPITTIVE